MQDFGIVGDDDDLDIVGAGEPLNRALTRVARDAVEHAVDHERQRSVEQDAGTVLREQRVDRGREVVGAEARHVRAQTLEPSHLLLDLGELPVLRAALGFELGDHFCIVLRVDRRRVGIRDDPHGGLGGGCAHVDARDEHAGGGNNVARRIDAALGQRLCDRVDRLRAALRLHPQRPELALGILAGWPPEQLGRAGTDQFLALGQLPARRHVTDHARLIERVARRLELGFRRGAPAGVGFRGRHDQGYERRVRLDAGVGQCEQLDGDRLLVVRDRTVAVTALRCEQVLLGRVDRPV